MQPRGAVDSRALAAFALAILALFLTPFPLVSASAATVAIPLAFVSRARLRAAPELSGARLGVAAVVAAGIALLLSAVPAALSLVMVAFGPRF